MNLLLVDDNINVLEALEFGIDYPSIGVDRVFSALSAVKAKDIIQKESIDLMLTDIEMPKGSGLELLEWVNREGYDIVTMFCTSYADFNYAQKAVELHSFDYFLKPIDFEDITVRIRKAVQKVQENQRHRIYEKHGKQWEKRKNSRRDSFWSLILSTVQEFELSEIETLIEEEELGFSLEEEFGMFLFRMEEVQENFRSLTMTMKDFVVRNILDEKVRESGVEPVGYFWYGKDLLFVIYQREKGDFEQDITMRENLMHVFSRRLSSRIYIFLAQKFLIQEGRERFETLIRLHQGVEWQPKEN